MSRPALTPFELELVARTVYGEARGEGWQGQLAVAWVIRNRVATPRRFGAGVAGVIFRPSAFSCWRDINGRKAAAADLTDPLYRACLSAAALVFADREPDPTGGANHYLTSAAYATALATGHPPWPAKMRELGRINNHVFLTDEGVSP